MEHLVCEEKCLVGVSGCRHGHRYEIPCSKAKAFFENPYNCVQKIEITMPVCGHKIRIKCYEEIAFLQNPKRCSHPCRKKLRDPSIECKRRCGDCLRKQLFQFNERIPSYFLNHEDGEPLCIKKGLCGHLCNQTTHESAFALFCLIFERFCCSRMSSLLGSVRFEL